MEMEKCLLSIDWDYFVRTEKGNWGSFLENGSSVTDLWYKRYIQEKMKGKDIQKSFKLSPELNVFWEKISRCFKITKDSKIYVSDSHALSYDIAKKYDLKTVCLFDSHADLGYGGLSSLNFEVNCSNWLGKLLKERQISEACIFYSAHTEEKPEYFKAMNDIFNIGYFKLENFNKNYSVPVIHVCRSGAWTPPWFDVKFIQFVKALGIPGEIVSCPARKWNPSSLSFSDQINYLLA